MNKGNIASIATLHRNGWDRDTFPKLPEGLENLADCIALPWRDAGSRSRKSTKVSPHKCKRTIRKAKIKGERVIVEYRH